MNRRSERLSMKDPIPPHYSYIGYLDYVDEDETDFTSESEPDSGSGIDASSSDNEELLEDFLHMYKTTKTRQRSRISKSGAIQSQGRGRRTVMFLKFLPPSHTSAKSIS
jgi:hypothetical protein